MKMMLLSAALFSLTALPAMAGSTTVQFSPAEGDPAVAVFRDDGTMSFNGGEPVTYTLNEAEKTVCASLNDSETCVTFETWGTEVGHSTPYTTSQGSSGMALVTATEE